MLAALRESRWLVGFFLEVAATTSHLSCISVVCLSPTSQTHHGFADISERVKVGSVRAWWAEPDVYSPTLPQQEQTAYVDDV